jgi:maltoporin
MRLLLFLGYILAVQFTFSQDTIVQKEEPAIKPRGYFRYGLTYSMKDTEQGQRLNLDGMGSIGGRHQEADWLELGTEMDLNRIMKWDIEPKIKLYTLFSMFPTKGAYMHQGAGVGIQELYIQVDDSLINHAFQFWAGIRYYRTDNIEACDYFNFNNLSGPTIGIKIKRTQFAILSDAPFQNNNGSQYGTTITPFRGRTIFALQHQLLIGKRHKIDLLGEFHYGGWDVRDSTDKKITSGEDWGTVLGLRHHYQITPTLLNRISIRRGWRIANGPKDDNWSSRTFVSVGNPNEQDNFDGANAWHFTNNMQFSGSNLFNFEAYVIYRKAQGADGALDFERVSNYKEDFTVGSRVTWFIADKFHFITEGSYQTKKYTGYTSKRRVLTANGDASVTHLAIGPMYVPTGKRNMFTRPTFRLIYAMGFYNGYAKEQRLSDYLTYVDGDVGHYLGVKTEFWF